MNRRNFLHTGSLGALGLSLPAGVLSLDWQKAVNVHSWLQQLAVATGARRRSSLFVWSQALRERIQQTNAFLAKPGFVSEDSTLYFYAAGQACCFYPLVLRHHSTGLNDLLVPVMGRRPDGQWQQLVVLTGYQLEALAQAAKALAEHTLPLQDLLLPTGFAPHNGSTYATLGGSVSMKTQLHNGKATTELLVRQGTETLYAERFISRHCLSTTPILAA